MFLLRRSKSNPLFLLFLFAGYCLFSPVRAGTVGTTTADLLKINQGTRPSAMGGAFTAMGDDVYSINYNPAGLSYIKATQLVILHLDSLADIQYEYVAFGTGWSGGNVLATNIVYRHSPPIDNQNGNPPVNTSDLLLSLSYARKITDSIRLGATIKYLNSYLQPFTATAVAGDLGIVLDRLPYGIRAGLSIQNLGTGMTFNPTSSADPLPMFIRFGLGTHQVFEGNRDFNAAVEVFKPSDQDIKLGLGAEFWLFPELFAVRGGYKIESLGALYGGLAPNQKPFPGVPNAFSNYSLGCTLTRRIDGDDFSVDISYNPADFTSTTQDTFFFALNFKFNQFRIF